MMPLGSPQSWLAGLLWLSYASYAQQPDTAGLEKTPAAESMTRGQAQSFGWAALSSSLLLYDSTGDLVQEIGLSTWEEDIGHGKFRRRQSRAGASRDGRFAWAWEKTETFTRGKPKQIEAAPGTLRFLGTEGQELWRVSGVESPGELEPAAMSDNGERIVALAHRDGNWSATAYDFIGSKIVETLGKGAPNLLLISPNGHFALVRWHPFDQPPSYSALDLDSKIALSLSTDKALPGTPTLENSGKVFIGTALLFDLKNPFPTKTPAGAGP